uniref:C2H2-type domain-containing protein n=1 Tax=Angiostrongylus cantonensis TaxID=6313 RepID=A0A0K0DN74_ANGCA
MNFKYIVGDPLSDVTLGAVNSVVQVQGTTFSLSPLITAVKEEPEEAPFFKVLHATDLLGTAGFDDEEDQPTASFVTSNERNLLRERFEKNFRCVPFNWTPPSILVTYSKPGIPANQTERSKEDYATCKLCGKTILASRFTNLSNHARRHAEAKKYRCAHCSFQHYEPFKVRSHKSKCRVEADPTSSIVTERLAPNSHEESSSLSSEQGSAADVKSESWVKVNQEQLSIKSACNSDEDTSSEQISEITADEEVKSDPDLVKCCLKNLVEHAKERCLLKQFECSLCGFANDNQLHVMSHAVTQHPNELPRVVEHK